MRTLVRSVEDSERR